MGSKRRTRFNFIEGPLFQDVTLVGQEQDRAAALSWQAASSRVSRGACPIGDALHTNDSGHLAAMERPTMSRWC